MKRKNFIFFTKRSTDIASNIVLVFASMAVALFAADLICKGLKLPSKYQTVMLLSGSRLYTDEAGVRRYEPNKDVEQAALIDGEISYRYRYRTNNLGFVSKYDYRPGQALDLMIVGDSVSEGQEVGPWLDAVQQNLWEQYGKTTQNLAIAGNGFMEFERAAAYAKSSLGAHKAMLIFIGDDMLRPGDRMRANEDCSTYGTMINPDVINCFSGSTTWHHYDKKLSDAELVRFGESRQRFGLMRMVRAPAIQVATTVAGWVCTTGARLNVDWWLARRYNTECAMREKSENALAVRDVPRSVPISLSDQEPSVPTFVEPLNGLIPAYTISAIERVLRLYGTKNVLLVAIPGGGHSIRSMQPEVVFNHFLDGKFNSPIQFVDLSESCEMPRELWAPRVGGGARKGWGHPTAEGYLKLQSCIISSKRVMEFSRQ